ncbi:MAG: response regulator transcription factor [Actinobacteria bacterium]|nr:response regulator transcription factor [Actinomycetota bacterium]
MSKKRILTADDDPNISDIVKSYLVNEGFDVKLVDDGAAVLQTVTTYKPDLIILDIGLPNMSGTDICKEIRKNSNVPIIMLTARSDESDRVVGLEIGADDYVVKPFSPKELVARVKAILRRSAEPVTSTLTIIYKGLELDSERHQVRAYGKDILLTPYEFDILKLLASNPGRVYTRGQLLEKVMGTSFEAYERVIDAHIKNLRKKIEKEPARPAFVLTVRGVGYKFNEKLAS